MHPRIVCTNCAAISSKPGPPGTVPMVKRHHKLKWEKYGVLVILSENLETTLGGKSYSIWTNRSNGLCGRAEPLPWTGMCSRDPLNCPGTHTTHLLCSPRSENVILEPASPAHQPMLSPPPRSLFAEKMLTNVFCRTGSFRAFLSN